MSWSKEDKKIFESSEVFKNMEDRILDNIKRLKIIASEVDGLGDSATNTAPKVDKLTESVGKLGDAMKEITSDSDDGEVGQSEEVKGDGYNITVETNAPDAKINSLNDKIEDEQLESEYFKSTIAELKKAAYDAAISGDIKLAYKIERAIDEIIEVRDEDK